MNQEDKNKIQTGFNNGHFDSLVGWNHTGEQVWFYKNFSFYRVEPEAAKSRVYERFVPALNLFLKHADSDNIDICFTSDIDDDYIHVSDLSDYEFDNHKLLAQEK